MSLLVSGDIIIGDRPFSNLRAENINTSSGSCKFLCVATHTTKTRTHTLYVASKQSTFYSFLTPTADGHRPSPGFTSYGLQVPPSVAHAAEKKHLRKINKDAARHGAEPQPDASQRDTQDLKNQSRLFRRVSSGPQGQQVVKSKLTEGQKQGQHRSSKEA